MSDILGILPQTVDVGAVRVIFGTLLAIEVKKEKGRLSEEQSHFLREVNDHGEIGVCAVTGRAGKGSC